MSQLTLRHRYRLESVDNGATFRFYNWAFGAMIHDFVEGPDCVLHIALDFMVKYAFAHPLVRWPARGWWASALLPLTAILVMLVFSYSAYWCSRRRVERFLLVYFARH